ncbi:hypothetical protein pb186bvf_003617 [Paramecium bursaria]
MNEQSVSMQYLLVNLILINIFQEFKNLMPTSPQQPNQGKIFLIIEGQQHNTIEIELQTQSLTKLKYMTIITLIYTIIEEVLSIICLATIPSQCQIANVQKMFIIIVTMDVLSIVQEVFGYFIISKYIENARIGILPMSLNEGSFTPGAMNQEIDQRNPTFKVYKYIVRLFQLFSFFFSQLAIYQNVNGPCLLGDQDNNLIWGTAITYLIIRYIFLGSQIITVLLIVIAFPFVYMHTLYQLQRKRGIPQAKIDSIQSKQINGKITEENLCIICLQEFINQEEYIQLECHPDHVFHKECLVSWLKSHPNCPKCRARI